MIPTFIMKTTRLCFLAIVAFLSCLEAQEGKKWPFHDQSLRDAAFSGLRLKLHQDGVFSALPKGITLFLDGDEELEDGWFMVTLRERHAEGSGADPDVSPAIAHFYVRASDGMIEWYDVVEDKRRPWAAFLESMRQP